MGNGAITGYIDVAQIALYVFWAFFAGLIYYLHRENKREGYPLENDRSGRVDVQGFPAVPAPKTFLLRDGRTVSVPNKLREEYELAAQPAGAWLGAPLEPTGNPMLDGIGPAAWSMRADIVDTTFDGAPRIVPLRAAPGFALSRKDPNPIGMAVVGADGVAGGKVVDLWVDQAEMLFRYLEVQTDGLRSVLLPVNFAKIGSNSVRVRSILGTQFASVPGTRLPDQITLREEERIVAYYGGGTLYATPKRQEPLL